MKSDSILFLLVALVAVGLIVSSIPGTTLSYITNQNINSSISNSQITTITYAHDKIHTGEHFFKRDFFTLPNSGNTSFSMYCDNATYGVHMILEFANQVEAEYIVYENVTITTNGTDLNYSNRNKNYPDTNCLELRQNPVFTGGRVLKRYNLGLDKQAGGDIRDVNEVVLKEGVYYVVSVENLATGSTNIINYLFDWYE